MPEQGERVHEPRDGGLREPGALHDILLREPPVPRAEAAQHLEAAGERGHELAVRVPGTSRCDDVLLHATLPWRAAISQCRPATLFCTSILPQSTDSMLSDANETPHQAERPWTRRRARPRGARSPGEGADMAEAWIIDAVRTPIGKVGGQLAGVRPDDLAAIVLRAVLARRGLPATEVEDVVMGCANQAGEDCRNVARMGVLLAGYPDAIPAATVNRLCGSGLEAVTQAARAIVAGDGHVFVAGGVESMTRAPWAMSQAGEGVPARQRDPLRHLARLALHEPEDGEARPHRLARPDRGERRGRAPASTARPRTGSRSRATGRRSPPRRPRPSPTRSSPSR